MFARLLVANMTGGRQEAQDFKISPGHISLGVSAVKRHHGHSNSYKKLAAIRFPQLGSCWVLEIRKPRVFHTEKGCKDC